MTGEGGRLPVVLPPDTDERLSSWLARLAVFYAMSVPEFLAKLGLKGRNVFDLEWRLSEGGICQTSCPLISCGVSDFRGAVFVFGVEPDWSSRLPVSGFAKTTVPVFAPVQLHREWRGLRVSRCPGQHDAAKRIALCRCVPLYQLAILPTGLRICFRCKTLGRPVRAIFAGPE